MTREEVLNMPAGREMDALIAEKIWGFVENPNNTASVSNVWFWVHPKDGVLIGIPFDIGGKIENTEIYDHQWERFCPSTDIADAWKVVNRLELFSKYCFYGSDADELWTVHSWKYGKPHFTGIESRTAPLAICRAALLAVMETA